MKLFAIGISLFVVMPMGSKRECAILVQSTSSGTPYCRFIDMLVAHMSITPESVEPSLFILMKISPGAPSSYMPTVM